jgi:hypothetical protein
MYGPEPPRPVTYLFGGGGARMGYSTMIYAMDLDRLQSAVGSGDAKLIQRLSPTRRKVPKNPRVYVNSGSNIFLNGQFMTVDELCAELSRPKWRKTILYYHEAARIRSGPWVKLYSLAGEIGKRTPDDQFEIIEMSVGDVGADTEELEELSAEVAAAELVAGRLSRPKSGSSYGYGLKRLCEEVGTLLTAIEGKGGMLKALRLDTPLSKERFPVKMPNYRDFPRVGYLTPAEVKKEVARLGGLDLAYPKDDLIEADRKEYLAALRKAAKKGLGVVAFYH